jgi:hypothetical protein
MRSIPRAGVLLVALACAAGAPARAADPPKPNVVFILADDRD